MGTEVSWNAVGEEIRRTKEEIAQALGVTNPSRRLLRQTATMVDAGENVTLVGGQKLYRMHSRATCTGYWCPIHNMSNHHMRAWQQVYNDLAMSIDRICPHGEAHPDPDSDTTLVQWSAHRQTVCDGCCKPQGKVKHVKAAP